MERHISVNLIWLSFLSNINLLRTSFSMLIIELRDYYKHFLMKGYKKAIKSFVFEIKGVITDEFYTFTRPYRI